MRFRGSGCGASELDGQFRSDGLIADSIDLVEYEGPNKRIFLLIVILKAFLNIRVVISYKCRGKYRTNRCSYFNK